jgi:class 3 adenylate cyclase
VLILIAERFDRRREPSDADVKRAASRYRQHYGEHVFHVIGDHMLAASFAPDSRHKRFLKRVSAELLATSVSDEDRARAIEP